MISGDLNICTNRSIKTEIRYGQLAVTTFKLFESDNQRVNVEMFFSQRHTCLHCTPPVIKFTPSIDRTALSSFFISDLNPKMGKDRLTGHRAKLSEAIRQAQDDIRQQLVPAGADVSDELQNEARKRAHLSSIDFNSFETVDLELEKPVERDPLCGREWIEEHLDYTRRYRITQTEIDSAADFRRQNTKECLAPGTRHNETIMILHNEEKPQNGDDQADSVISDSDESENLEPIGRQSPQPHDMNDERIVDYTLNPVICLFN